jgi:phytoene synthase
VVNPELAGAYAYCERLSQTHYENFPVASRLLPRAMRPHIAAVYAFARIADDMADEGARPARDRIADLDDWQSRLDAAAGSEPLPREAHADVFVALRETIRACRLPPGLFRDLLSAFRQDVTTTRYETWTDVLDYCRRSANPIGRLVLRIAGHQNAELDTASDALCTALQLTNFWQDFAVDWQKGRLYLPAETWEPPGARTEDLDGRPLTPPWRAALADAAARTRALFGAGRPVCDGVGGRLRLELRATWLGGTRVLDKLEAVGFDVYTRRPTLTRTDAPGILWRTLSWTRDPSMRTRG